MTESVATATAMAITGTAGLAGIFLGLEPYIPFLIGGIALFSYMVTHQEAEFKIKDGLSIVTGALIVGYLVSGLVYPISEVIYNFGIGLIPEKVIMASKSLQDGSIIKSMSNLVSFVLAGLSRNIFNKFFSSRGAIIDKASRKIGG
jgi:hypothetical protein